MEPLDALALASSTFVDVLIQVGAGQLTLPTPCDDWDVTALVGHVIVANAMSTTLLDGGSQDEVRALADAGPGDGDPITACRSGVDAQLTRFRAQSDWDAVVHHLIGDVPASQLLSFRIGDLTLHSWDLARAIGADDSLPDELVAVVYEGLKPMELFIGEIGMFGQGPSGTVGEDNDLQTRLLDLSGRRS